MFEFVDTFRSKKSICDFYHMSEEIRVWPRDFSLCSFLDPEKPMNILRLVFSF
jgi:hypothetical protein